MGSLRDREVACSASDRQGSNFESCVWRTVSSQSSHHPQEVLLAQFSLFVHKGGLKPDSFFVLSSSSLPLRIALCCCFNRSKGIGDHIPFSLVFFIIIFIEPGYIWLLNSTKSNHAILYPWKAVYPNAAARNGDRHQCLLRAQQRQHVGPMLYYCWPSVCKARPTIKQHWVNVLCPLLVQGHARLWHAEEHAGIISFTFELSGAL